MMDEWREWSESTDGWYDRLVARVLLMLVCDCWEVEGTGSL